MTDRSLPTLVRELMPRAKEELAELVSYQSVADPRQFPPEECAKAARWVAEALRAEGADDVLLMDTSDGTESVYAHLPGREGAPTVLLYCHYDVQPPLDEEAWSSPPFTLTEREGRWYGRGAADCKGNILMHLTALRALRAASADGALPVSVKVIAEGAEEVGGDGLQQYVRQHPALLDADAVVIGDCGNFSLGLPTATVTLRGAVLTEVEVATLTGNLHSGQFGGAAPDALAALVKVLDTLHDAEGNSTVDGLPSVPDWDGVAYPSEQFRADAGVLDGVRLMGSGSVADRLWARPSVTVLGIDCPPVVGATPSVQARARANVSLRVPPGMDEHAAQRALIAHLENAAPWGARVTVTPGVPGAPFSADTSGPAYQALSEAMREAYGRDMVTSGMGGSIPLTGALREVYPDAEIVLLGVEEPQARIHAVDESVAPEEVESMALSEALFLRRYAESAAG